MGFVIALISISVQTQRAAITYPVNALVEFAVPKKREQWNRKLEKKKWPPKRILKFSIVGIFGFTVAYGFLFGDSHSKLNVNTEKTSISTVWKGLFQEFIPVHGTVLPLKTIYLDAVEGGRVEKVFVEAGTLVHEGDAILKMTNTNLQLDVMHREAQLFEQINNLRKHASGHGTESSQASSRSH